MRFRPCIDLHAGIVKQIVGSTLRDGAEPATNFEAARPAAWFADLYRRDGLRGGHVVKLGPGNDEAAREALAAFPGGLQLGGGVDAHSALDWIEAGAAGVIVTSYVFEDGRYSEARLRELSALVGRDKLILDLSCAPRDGRYRAMSERWQRETDFELTRASLEGAAQWCHELLVHAVEVEGRQAGPDLQLAEQLARISPLPVTYAGGLRSPGDVDALARVAGERLDFSVGSALDLFGGSGLRYADLVERNAGAATGAATGAVGGSSPTEKVRS